MPANFKRPEFRSKAMREGARGTICVLCRERPTHSCAHLPTKQIGFMSGTATKCPDWLIADLCIVCHQKIDHGVWRNDIEIRMKAHCLTIQRRFDQGILIVFDTATRQIEDHQWELWSCNDSG